ncbi:hypothetical protein AB0H88_04055 [Nonomuraea sp. NPDC050680]|uniref:hypothetical protein n=1 Tax=Nonomuraea sp. NPDC050680 TaxID=3154630 RepID=UPI0033CC5033
MSLIVGQPSRWGVVPVHRMMQRLRNRRIADVTQVARERVADREMRLAQRDQRFAELERELGMRE